MVGCTDYGERALSRLLALDEKVESILQKIGREDLTECVHRWQGSSSEMATSRKGRDVNPTEIVRHRRVKKRLKK